MRSQTFLVWIHDKIARDLQILQKGTENQKMSKKTVVCLLCFTEQTDAKLRADLYMAAVSHSLINVTGHRLRLRDINLHFKVGHNFSAHLELFINVSRQKIRKLNDKFCLPLMPGELARLIRQALHLIII